MRTQASVETVVRTSPIATLRRRILSPVNLTAFATAHLLLGLVPGGIADMIFTLLVPVMVIPAILVVATAVTICIVLMGWALGMSLHRVVVGPLRLEIDNGRVMARVNHDWRTFVGSILMAPDCRDMTWRQCAAYLGTGTVAAAFVVFIVIGPELVFDSLTGAGASGLGDRSTFLRILPFAAVFVLFLEFIGGGLVVLRNLFASDSEKRGMAAVIHLNLLLMAGTRPRDLPEHLVSRPIGERDESRTYEVGLAALYVQELDRGGSIEQAVLVLDYLRQVIHSRSADEQAAIRFQIDYFVPLYHELAYCAARYHQDYEAARTYLAVAESEPALRVTALRTAAAVSDAGGDRTRAMRLAREARAELTKLPDKAVWRLQFESDLLDGIARTAGREAEDQSGLADGSAPRTGPSEPAFDHRPHVAPPLPGAFVRSFAMSGLLIASMWIGLFALVGGNELTAAMSETQRSSLRSPATLLSALLDGAPDIDASPEPLNSIPSAMRDMDQHQIEYLSAVMWYRDEIAKSVARMQVRVHVPYRQESALLAEAKFWGALHQQVEVLEPPGNHYNFHRLFENTFVEYAIAGEYLTRYFRGGDGEDLERAVEHLEYASEAGDRANRTLDGILGHRFPDATDPELIPALLTPSDLGRGWIMQDLGYDDGWWLGPVLPCSGDLGLRHDEDRDVALVRYFRDVEPEVFLMQMVVATNEETAIELLRRFEASLTCDRWFTLDDRVFDVESLDIGSFGDQSVAIRVSDDNDLDWGSWVSDVVMIREGEIVVKVWHYQIGQEPLADQTVELVEKALERLHAYAD